MGSRVTDSPSVIDPWVRTTEIDSLVRTWDRRGMIILVLWRPGWDLSDRGVWNGRDEGEYERRGERH